VRADRYPVFHVSKTGARKVACGGVAFYLPFPIDRGSFVPTRDMVCESCGKDVDFKTLDYSKAIAIEVVKTVAAPPPLVRHFHARGVPVTEAILEDVK
jgi:hypothetical protein